MITSPATTRTSRWAWLGGLALVAFVSAIVRFASDAPDASANSAVGGDAHPAVDVALLNMLPLETWGVSGQNPGDTQTETIDNLVWDIQQAGNRIFVGGAFLNVQEDEAATPIPQAFLAAFDIDTGAWIPTCTPQFDRAIYTLTVNSRGMLLVGGEFTTVNGTSREGLVALDPTSCDIDPGFSGRVERPWSTKRAMVRELEIVDGMLYAVGNFSHVDGYGGRQRAYKATRMDERWGTIDAAWKPEIQGSGAWGMAVDNARGRVHFVGFFSSVNSEPDSGYFHTVDTVTGASVAGLDPLPRNRPGNQPEMFDVAMGSDAVFVAGEQHILQVLDADTHEMFAFAHTGNTGCPGEGFDHFAYCGGFAGGAYQVAETIGDVVFAGCHCTFDVRNGVDSHYSSVDDARHPLKLVMAYDATTGAVDQAFDPDYTSPRDGPWTVASDTNGCLYVGGDLNRRGVRAGIGGWLGGFAKLCPDEWAPPGEDTTAPPAPSGVAAAEDADSVIVTWEPVEDPVVPGEDTAGLMSHLVFRDGAYIGWTDATTHTFTDPNPVAGMPAAYQVRAVDNADNRSDLSDAAVIAFGGSDTTPPSMPTDVIVTDDGDGDVTVSWTAATDEGSGVVSYLVYRDGAYIGWTDAATLTYGDSGLAIGATYVFRVRAVDGVGLRSDLSAQGEVTPGGPDLEPPTVPEPVDVVADGDGATVSWIASTDEGSGVVSYLVYRDGGYIGWTDAATTVFTDSNPPPGVNVEYSVRAVDAAENRSERSDPLTFVAGGADTTAPTVPANLVVVANEGATIEIGWDPASDDLSGIQSYLVYRDGAYIGWTDAATLSLADPGRTPGVAHSYEVRATDVAGNRSARSLPLIVVAQ